MRSIGVLLLMLLTGCGASGQATDSSPEATVAAEPSATDASGGALPSVSPELPPLGGGLTARPLDDPDGPQVMGYLEYLPPTYSADGEPSPLLVFLHGGGEAGDGSEEALRLVTKHGVPRLIADGEWSAARAFVVLSPQYGEGPASGKCGIGDELAQFLDFAAASYNVDESRIYLTGVSCGAIGVADYLAEYGGDRIAAAVLVSGHFLWALEDFGCLPLTEVPMWTFRGADDEVIPAGFVEEQVEQIRACEGAESVEADLTIYPDTDHVGAIAKTYDLSAGHDIYTWLLEHTREPAP